MSATMPQDVLEVTKRFMRDPIRILVKKEELTLEGIKQFYVAVDKEEWKLETLCDLYETLTITQVYIHIHNTWFINLVINSRFLTVYIIVVLFTGPPLFSILNLIIYHIRPSFSATHVVRSIGSMSK